jgi:hypothetical protein
MLVGVIQVPSSSSSDSERTRSLRDCSNWEGRWFSVSSIAESKAQFVVAEVRSETRDCVSTADGGMSTVALAVDVVLMILGAVVEVVTCAGVVNWARGVELSEEDSRRDWKELWKMALADSDGVIVAVVILEMTDLVSSSSLSSNVGMEFVTA